MAKGYSEQITILYSFYNIQDFKGKILEWHFKNLESHRVCFYAQLSKKVKNMGEAFTPVYVTK